MADMLEGCVIMDMSVTTYVHTCSSKYYLREASNKKSFI